MTIFSLRNVAIGLLIASAPVVAQTTPPPAPPAGGMMMHGGHGGPGRMHGGRMFASMSEAGRKTMMEAMGPRENRKAEHEQVRAGRDRMLAVLDADRLDTAALKRAMDDEQATVNASRERRQAAMLSGFAKLSTADRKAFVADARAMKTRMEARMQKWRGKGGMNGMGDMGDMPTPPM
jgi:hypothetical protein